MNLWAMPTEIYSQALRAWGILRRGGVWQSGRRIRTAFGLNYSQALRAWWLRPVSLRSPQGFTFDTSGRSPEERKALIALSRPHPRSPQGFTFDTSGCSPEKRKGLQSEKRYSTGILYTYLYFIFCSITNITGTMMRVRKNEKTTP